MARNIGAAGRRLRCATSITSPSVPISMSCWFKSSDIDVTQNLMCASVAGASDQGRFMLQAGGSIAGDPIRAATFIANGSVSSSVTTTGYSADTWTHACGVWAGTSSRASYINGGSKGTQATSRTVAGTLSAALLGVGESTTGVFAGELIGDIAEAAMWNIALTDGEALELSTGVSPLKIRPDFLIGYWRLIGGDGDVDWWLQKNMTVTGSVTDSQHPPLIHYPRGIQTYTKLPVVVAESYPRTIFRPFQSFIRGY